MFDSDSCWIEETPYENGTARCAGAASSNFFKAYDTFINVQGDMPDITETMIDRCEEWLKHYLLFLRNKIIESQNENKSKVDISKTIAKAIM